MTTPRIGIWLVGSKGGVATTATLGLCAIQQGIGGTAGLVSEIPLFKGKSLPRWDEFFLGGHEIRDLRLVDEANRLASQNHAIPPALCEACAPLLDEIDGATRPGTLHNSGETIRAIADLPVPSDETAQAAVDRLGRDMAEFAQTHGLDHVIVVNVASTEPKVDAETIPSRWEDLRPLLSEPDCPLPASSLYAVAALDQRFSHVNFTPSLGTNLPALEELATRRETRHMGCDGKTGETLMKSVLAPMFQHRNLPVMSWVGHNIFGNMDGRVLDDPANKAAKATSKDRLLAEILGYRPQTLVSIEYIESMGDWKTAWDHIHFQGFLGTPMTLQFTWQGCDSLLAAPLVLDLVRLTEWARRRGEIGLMPFLASFFKSPQGVSLHDFVRQFEMLEDWVRQGK